MLKGVVGLVTGGASGLGKATVERIVRQGGKVRKQPHRKIFNCQAQTNVREI